MKELHPNALALHRGEVEPCTGLLGYFCLHTTNDFRHRDLKTLHDEVLFLDCLLVTFWRYREMHLHNDFNSRKRCVFLQYLCQQPRFLNVVFFQIFGMKRGLVANHKSVSGKSEGPMLGFPRNGNELKQRGAGCGACPDRLTSSVKSMNDESGVYQL